MTTHTAMWFRWRSLQFQARRWLKHNDAVAIAAHALFHLNRAARNGGSGVPYVYALKSRFVEHLYREGRCMSATLQVQRLPCWDCAGSGESIYTGGWCWKCDGTGVYRTHRLYRFTFNVRGRRYIWHQPQRLVTFDVALTDEEEGEYERGPGSGAGLGRGLAELYYVTLHEYLHRCGLAEGLTTSARPSSLPSCLRMDLRRWLRRRGWYLRWQRRVARTMGVWRAIARFWRTGEWWVEDSIPF